MNEPNNLRMRLKEALDNLWARVKGLFDGLDERVKDLEEGGGGGGTPGPAGPPGPKGDPGTPAGFGTPTATVDANTGTPSVTVTASGPDTAKVFAFAFHNLKGESGGGGGGEANIIESISVNGVDIPPVNKNVNIEVSVPITDAQIDDICGASPDGLLAMYRFTASAAAQDIPQSDATAQWNSSTLTFTATAHEG
jgi:hypothetical protein